MKKRIRIIIGSCILISVVFSSMDLRAADYREGLTELTIGQTMNAVFLSIESAYAFDLYYRQTIGMSILFFSSGIILPNVLTKNESMDTVRARNINCATLWGISTGVLLGLSIDTEDMTTQAYTGLACDILATGSAVLLTNNNHFSKDALSVINSGALWGLIMGYSTFEIVDTDIRSIPIFLLIGQTAGLAGGYLLSRQNILTRERLTAIDLYMLFSGALVYGISTISGINNRLKWALTGIGIIAGAAIGYITTDSWAKTSTDHILSTTPDPSKEFTFDIKLPGLRF
ncbi:MAG: hypothetical protein GY754_40410 [bacterium]|nr:hypothetical protein [bacterium]